MNVVPNPVKGNTFKLSSSSAIASKMELVISDMQGRIVKRETIALIAGSNSNDINVSNLAPGTYNVYGIAADERSAVLRFVKQ